MKIEITKLNEKAVLPEYAHPGDAGMDVFAMEQTVLEPGERAVVQTGVAIAVPEGHVALVWDKSGRAVKDGIATMAGVIDSGYRGEVGIVVLNTSAKTVAIGAGEKVAQMLIQPVVSPELVEVDALDDTARGEDGFGSTGV